MNMIIVGVKVPESGVLGAAEEVAAFGVEVAFDVELAFGVALDDAFGVEETLGVGVRDAEEDAS
jgi:predicted secreted protein